MTQRRFQSRHMPGSPATRGVIAGVPIGTMLDALFPREGERKAVAIAQPATAAFPQMTPAGSRALALEPSSWNAEKRTIAVVWTTGARCPIMMPEIGLVEEELLTGARNVRLDRLNAGAPVLNCHNTYDVGGQIGVVVPGSAKITGNRGIATLQLSTREDAAPLVADIAAGIIRNVSVGYWRHVVEIDNSSSPPFARTIDWEPTEISFVTVPANTGAQTRNASELQPCVVRTVQKKENGKMNTSWLTRFVGSRGGSPAAPQQEDERDAPLPSATRQASVQYLRTMVRDLGDGLNLDPALSNEFVLEMAERQMTEADAHAALIHVATERQRHATQGFSAAGRAIEGGNRPTGLRAANALIYGEQSMDNPTFHANAVGDALYARLSGTKPSDAAREFMGMSMIQMASDMLDRQGVRSRGMSATEVLEAASWNRVGARAAFMSEGRRDFMAGHSTSDFPDLLTGAGQRFLLDVFAAAASPLKRIARQRTAKDFRNISGIDVSGFGTLEPLLENGEIKRGSVEARTESYKIETFAKIFALTREAIVNDDLGAFSNTTQRMARAAAETEAQALARLITSNPLMRDGHPLFATEHGNIASVGAAPSFAALDAGRLQMREQKDLDGVTPLATAPKFILSGPQRETQIEQLVAGIINPTDPSGVNPFVGKLEPLVDPRLTGPAWYMFADPNLSPVLEYAYLNDSAGPQMDTKDGWNTLGTEFRVYMDFGAGAIDARGGYKNPGAAG